VWRRASNSRARSREPEEGSCPSCCSIALVVVDLRRRCPDSAPVVRPATRGLRYPADPPKVEEIIAGITSVYLQGIDSGEIIETVHARRAPMIPVSVSLRL
jgi:hypothetical protein